MQSRLNKGLFKLGLHPDGKCPTCSADQDEVHLITECVGTVDLRDEINRIKKTHSSTWKYQDLASDPRIMDIIITYVQSKKLTFEED